MLSRLVLGTRLLAAAKVSQILEID